VERAKQEREQIIVKAQGEAKSARMVGDAIKGNPGFLELRRLEAARDIAHTISESSNRVFLSSDSLLLNVNDDGYASYFFSSSLSFSLFIYSI
jgi:prohibitin 2